MLYVTTRNKNDAHTAHKTLTADRDSDGGLFVPFQMPVLSREEILSFKDKSFGQSVAEILNLFFSARLDGWDVEFCIGRYPVKLVPMSHRIVVAETWHNPDWDFARIVRNLSSRIRGNDDTHGVPSAWAWIVIRIASLFGLYGQMLRQGLAPEGIMDVAVCVGDFSAAMAAWYAREMGLPVGTIICSCNDNCSVWDLLHHGEMHTDTVAVPTNTPECDVGVPTNIERLIFGQLGVEEVTKFLEASRQGAVYAPSEDDHIRLRKGMYAAVISHKRMESMIYNVYRTSTYLLDPYSALAYGGLQDYRATVGEGRTTLLLAERSPVCSAATVAKAMGITVQELKERVNLT